MPHKLLLLENDSYLRNTLVGIFQTYGWDVKSAASILRARELIIKDDFELVVADRLLPDGDGLEFVEYLRDWYPGTKVLCLTSEGKVSDRISGFSHGADDYLAKPFATQELIWRVKSLLSKQKLADTPHLEHHNLKFFPENGLVIVEKQKINLRRRENQILLHLLRHKGSVVTRKALIDALWPGEQELPLTTTLDVYIRRVRQKLRMLPSLITTVRGYGYMINA